MEPEEPVIGESPTGRPQTKAATEVMQQPDEAAVLHYYQTDHRMILIHHVELRDTVYVQTLTEEDMQSFNMTEEERSFGEAYVVQLNELLKHN